MPRLRKDAADQNSCGHLLEARHRALLILLVKLGSDSSTHLKVFLQTHSGKLETATYLVRASLSNLKLELNSDLNINLNLNSNFESGGPPSPSLIQPQDYKRGLLIIWKANKI